MVTRLHTAQCDFTEAFKRFLALRQSEEKQVGDIVEGILRQVQTRGDQAVFDYTRQFDRFEADHDSIRVTPREIAHALSLCHPELITSLKLAGMRIREYSQRQMPSDLDYKDEHGIRLGHRWTPIQSVGLYVPGGTASYPSSVLMNAIPARVAGVERLVMVVPSPEGKLNPALLAAAHVAGIEEIYKVGGAQAVGMLAYGTQSVRAVDKIVGPGNAYVAEAKRQVFGRVGIDMIAGPSEILVIADNKNPPAWIAADLLSQAEHDVLAQSVLITDDEAFAARVSEEIGRLLETLPRAAIAEKSWEVYGAIILVKDWDEACAISNTIAPEHLELAVEDPDALLPKIAHAGAVFLGRHTPEAIGDYLAGPSHVLPTSGTARFSSGLSVFDFLKRTSLIGCSAPSLSYLSPYAEVLAATEGLDAHALSITLRREPKKAPSRDRLVKITLDESSIKKRSAEVEHEKSIAIADLLDENLFRPLCMGEGPYEAHLSIGEGRLIFDIKAESGETARAVLPIQPLRRTIRDYFMICESYYEALKHAGTGKIEAIDMGRRGIHNEGSEALQLVLKDRIRVDFPTARRLFTLICVLHIK